MLSKIDQFNNHRGERLMQNIRIIKIHELKVVSSGAIALSKELNFFEKWSRVYIDCKGKDKKTVIEEHFSTLFEKYQDLNELYDEVQEYFSYS
jgi:hypothetical protein